MQSPEALFLLLVPAFLFIIWRFRTRFSALPFPRVSLPVVFLERFSHLPSFLELLCLVLLAVALSRPLQTLEHGGSRVPAVDIMLALDASYSMWAPDFSPTRLRRAVSVLKEFILKRTEDRIGIVAFGGEAQTRAPLTFDSDTVLRTLEKISPTEFTPRTAIGEGLAVSGKRLLHSQTKSKVVILLTDGNNNAGSIDPFTAAEALGANRIKLYIIGVGGPRMIEWTQKFPDGNVYRMQAEPLREEELRKIARAGAGKFFRAKDASALRNVFRAIDSLEKTEIKKELYHEFKDLFPFLLSVAFGLLLFSRLFNLFTRSFHA